MFLLETEDVKSFKLDKLLKQVEGGEKKKSFPHFPFKTYTGYFEHCQCNFSAHALLNTLLSNVQPD